MPKKLYRSRKDKMLAGVCGGLAEYFEVDTTLVRLAAVALTLAWGTGILAYLIFWFVVPQRPLEFTVSEAGQESPPPGSDEAPAEENEASSAALVFGIILVLVGFLILMGNFISLAWLSFSRLWPLFLIALGIIIILKGSGKKREG
jgi:phage shock protein PspC (stress-responsive transcriptional regulator)